jgi:hypothetical protein
MSHTISQVSKINRLQDFGDSPNSAPLQLREVTGLSEILGLELEDGRTYAIDKQDPIASVWTEFIAWQQETALPVFVEADRESSVVIQLLPVYERLVDVVDPYPVDGRLRVVFKTSPALFFLNPALPRFTEWRAKLESAVCDKAALLVTHHPLTFEVLDVRDAPETSTDSAEALPQSIVPASVPTSEISLARAFQVFGVLAQSDIPFRFLRDCCSARAHRMCQILADNNIVARKLWNYGRGFAVNKRTLCVKTTIDPAGEVCWVFHVAPIVNVTDDPIGTVVLDPSIFDRPVAISTWLLAQNDNSSFQEITDANNFGNKPNSPLDELNPTPDRVDGDLKKHAGELILLKGFHSLLFGDPTDQ